MKMKIRVVVSLLIVLSGVGAKKTVPDDKWYTGFVKLSGACHSVGGWSKTFPFQYSTMDDCLENKADRRYNEDAERQEGYVPLDNGECLKVWCHYESNPFPYLKEDECKDRQKTTLATRAINNDKWYTGFVKLSGACHSVGGWSKTFPFQYSTMDDCLENKADRRYNEDAERQEGYVPLDNGECLKVWCHYESNPFPYLKEDECKDRQKTTLATRAINNGLRLSKRSSGPDGMMMGKFVLEATFTALSLINPGFALMIPILNLLYPSASGPSAWEQVRSQVKAEINQKMNEAYAKRLENYLNGLKRQLETYNTYSDSNSHKIPKIEAIDNSLGVKEGEFMRKEDSISTLTYFVVYASLRLAVKVERIRLAKPSDKQQLIPETLKLAQRYIPYLGDLAYGSFEKWRRSNFKCTMGKYHVARYRYNNMFQWQDTVKSDSRTYKRTYPWSTRQPSSETNALNTWCRNLEKPAITKMNTFVNKLRVNVRAWATIFNEIANSPFTVGFDGAHSKITTDNKECKLPFKYGGRTYTSCTAAGNNGRHWCYKKAGGWGNCFSVGKLNIDLTSCQMNAKNSEQYFGHKNVAENGKTCNNWSKQSRYKDFPMDNQDKQLVGNYCRRLLPGDYRPWCYTPSGWSYCSIRKCTSRDWA